MWSKPDTYLYLKPISFLEFVKYKFCFNNSKCFQTFPLASKTRDARVLTIGKRSVLTEDSYIFYFS